ncbi:uncharacterized protein LOC141913364 [Tubulanus polymorphus]|uniref:uncharacterized protein LOC141913364 n=1 Tax=Tubulanus polymorphus TaxID=672921 RepID=UPI003DA3FCAB
MCRFVVFTYLVFACAVLVVECKETSHSGPTVPKKDGAQSLVKCPSGKLRVACTCEPWSSCDGAEFAKDGCIGSNTGRVGSTKSVIKCTDDVQDIYFTVGTKSVTVANPSVTCPLNSIAVSCTAYTHWGYPGKSVAISNDGRTCKVSGCDRCKVQARCKIKKQKTNNIGCKFRKAVSSSVPDSVYKTMRTISELVCIGACVNNLVYCRSIEYFSTANSSLKTCNLHRETDFTKQRQTGWIYKIVDPSTIVIVP